jgi:hypothetical protein
LDCDACLDRFVGKADPAEHPTNQLQLPFSASGTTSVVPATVSRRACSASRARAWVAATFSHAARMALTIRSAAIGSSGVTTKARAWINRPVEHLPSAGMP